MVDEKNIYLSSSYFIAIYVSLSWPARKISGQKYNCLTNLNLNTTEIVNNLVLVHYVKKSLYIL